MAKDHGVAELDDSVLDDLVVESRLKTVGQSQRHWMGLFFWALGSLPGPQGRALRNEPNGLPDVAL